MAAQITLFAQSAGFGSRNAQVPQDPFDSKTATFTATKDCIAQVYANGADVSLTINSITWTVPSGMVLSYGVRSGQTVTVA